jgi:branched-chain amino acid transport system permease protein
VTEVLGILVVGILLGGIYGLVALGLNLIFGVVRIVNFAHGELVMLGMYGTYVLFQYGISPYLAVFIVAPALFVLGVLLQRFILQPLQAESSMQIFATFGLLMVFQNVALGITRGQSLSIDWSVARQVISFGGIHVSVVRLVTLLSATAITLAMYLFLRHTMPGRAVRAVIQDKRAARTLGIDVERTYVIAFGVGAALAGIAGALLMPIYSVTPWIGGNFVLAAFAVVVLGGLGSVWGAYLGGLIVGVIEAFAGFYIDPALRQAIWFLIFIAVLVVRPSGLLGHVGAEEVGFREQH